VYYKSKRNVEQTTLKQYIGFIASFLG